MPDQSRRRAWQSWYDRRARAVSSFLEAIRVKGVIQGLLPRLNAVAHIDARGRSIKTETKIVVRVNNQLPFRKNRSVQGCEPHKEICFPGSLFNLPAERSRRRDRTL